MIESGKPDRDERRVEAMIVSLHSAFDHQPRDRTCDDAVGAALGIDPDDPAAVPEDWAAAEMVAAR